MDKINKIEKTIDNIDVLDIEYTGNVDIIDIIDIIDNVNIDDIYNIENVNYIENIDCDVINDEIEELKLDKNKHLFFTNIMTSQIININRDKYKYWLNEYYEDLKNIYIKLYCKYFNLNNLNINFNKFTEFCYLYY